MIFHLRFVFGHWGHEKSSFQTVFVKLTLSLLRPSTPQHPPLPSATGCNHLLGMWTSRRPAACSTFLTTKTDSLQRPRYRFFSLVQKYTHFHPHMALHILHSYILLSTEQWLWQHSSWLHGCYWAIELVRTTLSPCTLVHWLLHLYTSRRCKKINVHWKLKGRLSQVCPQVRGALWDIDEFPLLQKPCWDNTPTRILLTEAVQTVHLGKVGQYFIIRWDEICLQSQYRKNKLEWKFISHQKAQLPPWLLRPTVAFVRNTFFHPCFLVLLTWFTKVWHNLSSTGDYWLHTATLKHV